MRWAWIAVLLALVPSLASAAAPPLASASSRQGKPASSGPAAPSKSGPDLFGGYSYTHAGDAGLNGWELSGGYPFRGRLRFAADLSGH